MVKCWIWQSLVLIAGGGRGLGPSLWFVLRKFISFFKLSSFIKITSPKETEGYSYLVLI